MDCWACQTCAVPDVIEFLCARDYIPERRALTMTNIPFNSRRINGKSIGILVLAGFISVAAVIGCCLMPGASNKISWWHAFSLWPFDNLWNRAASINACISVGLALFTWSVFRLIRPVHPNRSWRIVQAILVPLCWLLLLLALDGWLVQLWNRGIQVFGTMFPHS